MIRFNDACGCVAKTVAVRLLPDTDLIEGIEAACEKNKIKHAYVSCFGSFKKAGYMYLVPKESAKVKAGYGDVIKKDVPVPVRCGRAFPYLSPPATYCGKHQPVAASGQRGL